MELEENNLGLAMALAYARQVQDRDIDDLDDFDVYTGDGDDTVEPNDFIASIGALTRTVGNVINMYQTAQTNPTEDNDTENENTQPEASAPRDDTADGTG